MQHAVVLDENPMTRIDEVSAAEERQPLVDVDVELGLGQPGIRQDTPDCALARRPRVLADSLDGIPESMDARAAARVYCCPQLVDGGERRSAGRGPSVTRSPHATEEVAERDEVDHGQVSEAGPGRSGCRETDAVALGCEGAVGPASMSGDARRPRKRTWTDHRHMHGQEGGARDLVAMEGEREWRSPQRGSRFMTDVLCDRHPPGVDLGAGDPGRALSGIRVVGIGQRWGGCPRADAGEGDVEIAPLQAASTHPCTTRLGYGEHVAELVWKKECASHSHTVSRSCRSLSRLSPGRSRSGRDIPAESATVAGISRPEGLRES